MVMVQRTVSVLRPSGFPKRIDVQEPSEPRAQPIFSSNEQRRLAFFLLSELRRMGLDAGLSESIPGGDGVPVLLLKVSFRAGAGIADINPALKLTPQASDGDPYAVQAAPSTDALPDEPMTARERTVLQLIGQGLSNKRIARDLNIAPETVKSHTKHIFYKLGTNTRAHAVACAVKRGLL